MAADAEDDAQSALDEQGNEEFLRMQERVGQTVGGKYKIVRALGVGGMGGVYEAEHLLIGKMVALKCLHREFARERDLVERFKREARAATTIGNEHIVDVTDMGDLPDGAPFIVMEVLRGQALASLMDEQGPLPIGRAVRITRQVCEALAAAHDKGIVHRDMKPENVFLTTRGGDPDFVKVLDFGISKMHEHGKNDRGLTRTGVAMGTPSYMSPEQAQGSKDVDLRTDVWALGVMLYELLVGRRPFEADSYPMMLMAIVGRDPEPVRHHRRDVPEALDSIVLSCLEKPMGTRMQSMRALLDALAPYAAIDGEPDMLDASAQQDRRSVATSAPRRKGEIGPQRGVDDAAKLATAGTAIAPSEPPPPQRTGERTPAPKTRVAGSNPVRQAARAVDRDEESEPGDWGGEAHESDRPRGRQTHSSPRTSERTGELGSAEREPARSTRERTAEMEGASRRPEPPSSSRAPLYGALVVVVALVGAGAWASGAFGGAPVADVAVPPTALAHDPAPPAVPAVTEPVIEAPRPPPAEVHLEVTTNPSNALLEIGGVTFPNPMSAARPRSLDPLTIRVSLDGYQTIERLVILDEARSFHFELARGRGVRLEDAEGRVRAPREGHTPPAGAASDPPDDPPPAGGDRFREEF